MKETIFKIFDTFTEGVDMYYHNGSMWLIFTDEQKWVIELAQDGILWYNYYFFQNCFKYVSLDVVENQHYITEWVETIIQNGVKETKHNTFEDGLAMEEAIQNGVKRTELGGKDRKIDEIKDIVENGIKETHEDVYQSNARVWGVVNNGIKQTIELPDMSGELNGYGEYYARQKDKTYPHDNIVNDVINGN